MESKKAKVSKIEGKNNPADICTKPVDQATLNKHFSRMGFETNNHKTNTTKPAGVNNLDIGGVSGDYWICEGTTWVRVHTTPRRALFTPTRTSSGPDPTTLRSRRRTEMQALGQDGSTKNYRGDIWTDRISAHKDMGYLWVGRTIFYTRWEDVTEEDRDCEGYRGK